MIEEIKTSEELRAKYQEAKVRKEIHKALLQISDRNTIGSNRS
jgi:hypothetical protein